MDKKLDESTIIYEPLDIFIGSFNHKTFITKELKMYKRFIFTTFLSLIITVPVFSQIVKKPKVIIPGGPEMPLVYKGKGIIAPNAPDGHLMYCPGVQSIEISRANRKHPPNFPLDPQNHLGWTYQHHVGLGVWNGELYAVWDMTHKGEDNPPDLLVYSTSSDGFHWSDPKYLFPPGKAYNLRFYFFHASNGRMLVFGAGWYKTKNISEAKKTTLVVRELRKDHTLGKIYTLINPGPTFPPYYTTSKDTGFIAACKEAYNNKPLLEQQDYGALLGSRRMKWHNPQNWPGGHLPTVAGNQLMVFGKALDFFHRKDGTLVGLSKMGFVTISKNNGKTWSKPVVPKGIIAGGGKLWGQRTQDGRYIMVYNPQHDRRWPLVITTSNNGITFRNMRVIQGEVPPQRYVGRAKDMGPQYVRGVTEWGGDAPSINNSSVWVIYSMNKEDIWVSRIPVPVRTEAKWPVNDTFENDRPGMRVPGWNTYSPIWAPVTVAENPKDSNHYLQLKDRAPVDYARAIRTFPISQKVNVKFRICASQAKRGRLEIDLLGTKDQRTVRIVFNNKGMVTTEDASQPVIKSYEHGLTGTYFKGSNFSRPAVVGDTLKSFGNNWGSKKGNGWSARWKGLLVAPFTGKVHFYAEAKNGLKLSINNKNIIDDLSKNSNSSGAVLLKKGKKVPITIGYRVNGGGAKLYLYWSWSGKSKTIIPSSAILHEIRFYKPVDLATYKVNKWLNFNINANCKKSEFDIRINGHEILNGAKFPQNATSLYALSFRTGKYRRYVTGRATKDIPNTSQPIPASIYKIDNVGIRKMKNIIY